MKNQMGSAPKLPINVPKSIEFINKLTAKTDQGKVTWRKGDDSFFTTLGDGIRVDLIVVRDEVGEYSFKRFLVQTPKAVEFEYANPHATANRYIMSILSGGNPMLAALDKLVQVVSRQTDKGLSRAID